LSAEAAWRDLEADRAVGTLKRIDETHASAFYATRDFEGRRGMLLVAPTEPPELPQLKALDIKVITDANGNWQIYIWLANDECAPLFALLCEDLMESSRSLSPAQTPAYIASRLGRWRRLFEAGASNILPPAELRGLIGELAVLRECFERMSPADAVVAWRGPLNAPQDFAFSDMLIETKTAGPTALRVRISSADQLDAPYSPQLILALVLLAPAAVDIASGFSVATYVEEISASLRPYPHAAEEFASRLRAAGYSGHPDYAKERFRIDGIRYFIVSHGFPRLVRSDLMAGITDASYDIELSAIAPFETVVGGRRGS
jgi:hypothetical protein